MIQWATTIQRKRILVGILSLFICTTIVLIINLSIGLRPCGWLDDFLKRSGCSFTLDHKSVRSLAFSPDGTILATLSIDNSIRLWTVNDKSLLYSLDKLDATVESMVFVPDGSMLAVASYELVQFWRISDGVLSHFWKGDTRMAAITFSPQGDILASGSYSEIVRLWQADNGTPLHNLRGHRYPIEDIAFSPDGTILASGAADSTIRLWRVSDGTLLNILEGHTNTVDSVVFASDGATLASGSVDGTIRLWRVSDGTLLRIIKGHRRNVLSVASMPSKNILASGGLDNSVRLWRINDGTLLHKINHRGWVFSVKFSPDGRWLVSGQRYGSVSVFNIQQWALE